MPGSPHDALFRYTFGQPEHAAPLLRSILPPSLGAACDWSTLALDSGTRVDRRLRRHQTDLLYSVRTAAADLRILLVVEHLSRSDRWTALRLLDYTVGVWRQIVRQRPRPARLPRIVPIVVHHGRRDWRAPTELVELLEPAGKAGEPEAQPRFRYLVRSFAGIAPAELDALALTVLGRLSIAALQFLPSATAAQAFALFTRWASLFRRLLAAPSGAEAMAALSEYALTTARAAPEALIEIVEQTVDRQASKIMQTAAAQLRHQGRVEGIAEGRIEGLAEGRIEGIAEGRATLLTRLLERRFGPLPADVTARLRGGTADELDRWALAVLDAATLDEVFAPK